MPPPNRTEGLAAEPGPTAVTASSHHAAGIRDSSGNIPDKPGYAAAFDAYHRLGWPSMLWLPPGKKKHPPKGYTGRDGADPSYADMYTWAQDHPDANICLRLPDGIIGIDVDAYGDETGARTLIEAEKRWGMLPPTWRSSSRPDDPISGIRLYRVPSGTRLVTQITFPELGIGDIEIIQRHHRYVVCWPSMHPEGRMYRWYAPDGKPAEKPPALADLPELS